MPAPARSCNFRAGIFDGMDLASPGISGSPSGAGQGGESGRPAAQPWGLARFALSPITRESGGVHGEERRDVDFCGRLQRTRVPVLQDMK